MCAVMMAQIWQVFSMLNASEIEDLLQIHIATLNLYQMYNIHVLHCIFYRIYGLEKCVHTYFSFCCKRDSSSNIILQPMPVALKCLHILIFSKYQIGFSHQNPPTAGLYKQCYHIAYSIYVCACICLFVSVPNVCRQPRYREWTEHTQITQWKCRTSYSSSFFFFSSFKKTLCLFVQRANCINENVKRID